MVWWWYLKPNSNQSINQSIRKNKIKPNSYLNRMLLERLRYYGDHYLQDIDIRWFYRLRKKETTQNITICLPIFLSCEQWWWWSWQQRPCVCATPSVPGRLSPKSPEVSVSAGIQVLQVTHQGRGNLPGGSMGFLSQSFSPFFRCSINPLAAGESSPFLLKTSCEPSS